MARARKDTHEFSDLLMSIFLIMLVTATALTISNYTSGQAGKKLSVNRVTGLSVFRAFRDTFGQVTGWLSSSSPLPDKKGKLEDKYHFNSAGDAVLDKDGNVVAVKYSVDGSPYWFEIKRQDGGFKVGEYKPADDISPEKIQLTDSITSKIGAKARMISLASGHSFSSSNKGYREFLDFLKRAEPKDDNTKRIQRETPDKTSDNKRIYNIWYKEIHLPHGNRALLVSDNLVVGPETKWILLAVLDKENNVVLSTDKIINSNLYLPERLNELKGRLASLLSESKKPSQPTHPSRSTSKPSTTEPHSTRNVKLLFTENGKTFWLDVTVDDTGKVLGWKCADDNNACKEFRTRSLLSPFLDDYFLEKIQKAYDESLTSLYPESSKPPTNPTGTSETPITPESSPPVEDFPEIGPETSKENINFNRGKASLYGKKGGTRTLIVNKDNKNYYYLVYPDGRLMTFPVEYKNKDDKKTFYFDVDYSTGQPVFKCAKDDKNCQKYLKKHRGAVLSAMKKAQSGFNKAYREANNGEFPEYVQKWRAEQMRNFMSFSVSKVSQILAAYLDNLLGPFSNGVPSLLCGDSIVREKGEDVEIAGLKIPHDNFVSKKEHDIFSKIRTAIIGGERAELTEDAYRYAVSVKLISEKNGLKWQLYLYNSCTHEDSKDIWLEHGTLSKQQYFINHFAGNDKEDMVFECSVDKVCRFNKVCLKFNDEAMPRCVPLIGKFSTKGKTGSLSC